MRPRWPVARSHHQTTALCIGKGKHGLGWVENWYVTVVVCGPGSGVMISLGLGMAYYEGLGFRESRAWPEPSCR